MLVRDKYSEILNRVFALNVARKEKLAWPSAPFYEDFKPILLETME
jgi:hypothetical protein